MDVPYWLVLASLGVLTFLGLAIWAVASIAFPLMQIYSVEAGLALASLFVGVTFWVALGERSLRRGRLRSASNLYRLGALSAIEFEEAASELFRLQGYIVVENRRPDDEDGGVDLEIAKGDEKLLVQVKNKWEDVGVREARELWGLVASEHADGAVFVTSRGFTPRAVEFASGKRFELIDGQAFLTLRAQLLPSASGTPDHDPVVSAGFARHLSTLANPACPKCGKPMVMITALSGTSITRQFWGCSSYPVCQSSRRSTPYRGEETKGEESPRAYLEDRVEVARTNRVRLRLRRRD